ncbi:MAG: DoxX family protein [Rhodothermales bacterium]|nr:DoxX family protein [Rhodothermales bacterium]MBO6781493.1 DoxX family protein [Rhodothermales bacterium]
MPDLSLVSILQVVVGLGLLNVWLLRAGSETSYRGGDAKSLKAEFAAYGLSDAAFYVVGGLKILAGIGLLVGLWVPEIVMPCAAVVAVLMVGALAMHIKVGDPVMKSVPAALMLVMCLAILFLG